MALGRTLALLALAVAVAVVALIMPNNETSPASGANLSTAERIKLHWKVARAVAAKIGVPAFAAWAVGQAGAESSWGGPISKVYAATNNPFGIKAGSWTRTRPADTWQAADGTFYRKFPTLERAYEHLAELYTSYGVDVYTRAWPLLAAGRYSDFARAIGPTYEPKRPAEGKGSYAEWVLENIATAERYA